MKQTGIFTFVLISFFLLVNSKSDTGKNPANGFGEDFDWVEWPNAISTALDLNKPIFLLIHKTWCGACKALKNSFNTSSKRKELIELSRKFVMANTEDDDEPEEDEYAPDGRYIPRLFFLNKYGKLLDVNNKKNYENNAHYFPQVPDVLRGMKLALKLFEEENAASPDEPQVVPDQEEETNAVETDERVLVKETDNESKEANQEAAGNKNVETQESNVVSKEEDDSLGEIYLSDEELDIMESGGCPHANAARAAARAAERNEAKNNEKAQAKDKTTEKKKTKKTETKKTDGKKEDAKKTDKKSKQREAKKEEL